MSLGTGPGHPGPVSMRSGEGATSGMPAAPERSHGRARWFSLGLTTGIVATLIVVVIVLALTR